MESSKKDIDCGWAWVVMFASFLSLILNGTLLYGAGVIHVALLREFGESDAFTSFVGSLFTSLLSLVGPLSSVLINLYSCRTTMYIGGILLFIGLAATFFAESLTFCLVTYGVIAGIGNGLSATPQLVSVGYYFQQKRAFAIGIVVSGAGLGMFISGPLFQAMVNEYGLRGTFFILGALGANQIVFGALMRPSSVEIWHQKNRRNTVAGNKKNSISSKLQLHLFTDKMFLIILSQFLIWNIPFSMLILHLPNFAVVKGSSETDAAFLILLVGLTGTIGRALTGMSVGPHGIDPVLMNVGLTGLAGIITLLFPLYSSSYLGQCIFASIFGIYSGGLTCMITPLNVELLGLANLSTAVGIMYFIGGIGYIIGPTVAGLIIDIGGTYEVTLYVSGVLFLLASFLTIVSSFWRTEIREEVIKDGHGSLDNIKNSIFLNQSGLAGSMIIKVDAETDSLKGSLKYLQPKRALGIGENYDSQNSLFREYILKDKLKNRSTNSSQYSLFKETTSSLHSDGKSFSEQTDRRSNPNIPCSLKLMNNKPSPLSNENDVDENITFLEKEISLLE